MKTGLYDSADVEWSQTMLYRDLMVADSAQLAQFIRCYRPLHIAVTAIDAPLQPDSEDWLRSLLRIVSTEHSPGRYERIVLVSESNAGSWRTAIEFIVANFPDVLLERRVFCTWARPSDEGIERMYRAIGAAQAVSLKEGVWRVPELL